MIYTLAAKHPTLGAVVIEWGIGEAGSPGSYDDPGDPTIIYIEHCYDSTYTIKWFMPWRDYQSIESSVYEDQNAINDALDDLSAPDWYW